MANRPRSDTAGRIFNDLRNVARREGRTTDELITTYVLERWLYRMSISGLRSGFVLKGGLLLAAYDARRSTRDCDLLTRIDKDSGEVVASICRIAGIQVDDGVAYQTDQVRVTTIREDDRYGGYRVTMPSRIGRTRAKLALDVNFGDPITPGVSEITYPSVLPGPQFTVLGYPIETILAEKMVTAITRGEQNTRDRDWADVWRLTGTHQLGAEQMLAALNRTAAYRGTELRPLATCIGPLAEERAQGYAAWLRRQGTSGAAYPVGFAVVVQDVLAFTEPLLSDDARNLHWRPTERRWLRRTPEPGSGRTDGAAGLGSRA